MNIAFYTPVNFRCRDIESLAMKYAQNGHRVFLLSQGPEGKLHEAFRERGLHTSFHIVHSRRPILRLVRYFFLLILFCRKNRIDLLYSHLEPTNFVSVLAQYFIRCKVVIYRHHINEAHLYKFDTAITYRLTYLLAKAVVTVSQQARQYMIDFERVSGDKIFHINLGYDFSRYPIPSSSAVQGIQSAYRQHILLASVGRLTKYKRHDLAINLTKKVNDAGINASLMILGVGESENELRDLAKTLAIQDKVFFVGYTDQILNYLAAADILVHPSIMESSCVAVKEAALTSLPVIVCKDVGDFNDYLIDTRNGIVVDKDRFVDEALLHIKNFDCDPLRYRAMGDELQKVILKTFSIDNVFDKYSRFEVND